MTRKSGSLQKFALVLASVLVTLVCAEGVLRLTSYRFLLFSRHFPPGYYTPAEGGFDIKPNVPPTIHKIFDINYQVWSNELGCFDTPYKNEQPYIFLTGDSFAWGYAPFADKWGTRLESYMGQRVLKCGVAGYGTRQELLKTRRLLSTLPKPRQLVVSYYVNDPEDDYTPDNSIVVSGDRMPDPGTTTDAVALVKMHDRLKELLAVYCTGYEPAHPTWQRVKCVLRKHSVVYALMGSAAKRVGPVDVLRRVGIVATPPRVAPKVVPTANGIQQHLQNILDFKTLADSKGASLLVVMIPDKGWETSNVVPNSYSRVESFMDAHGISYYDPLLDFRSIVQRTGASLYWKFDVHLNQKGNHLLALLVARKLLSRPEGAALRARVEKDLRSEFSYIGQ